MSLSADDVRKVALLARLQLSDDALERMTRELSAIVGYVEQLEAIDTEGVVPMAHALELRNVLADDEPRPSLPREEALANAPARDEACYRVPPVL